MYVNFYELNDGESFAGAHPGRLLLTKLIAATATPPQAFEPLFIDFEMVDVATASFLRESIIAIRTLLRGQKSTLYLVVCNANVLVQDELEILLPTGRDALLGCDLKSCTVVSNVRLIGKLEDKQRRVFEFVEEKLETDAGELQQAFGEIEGVQQTAWNNRLTALASLGLIVEVSRGRAKRYRSLLKGG